MGFPECFELPDLILERVTMTHLPDWERLFNDERVLHTLGGLRPDGWVKDNLANQVEHWETMGFGLWVMRNPEDNDFVGRGGLHAMDFEGDVAVEVAYALMPAYWGKGLATELARASVAIAQEFLDIDELLALTLPDNLASQRVMEKSGFIYEREVIHAELPHSLFRQPVL